MARPCQGAELFDRGARPCAPTRQLKVRSRRSLIVERKDVIVGFVD
jgi:hypothetical protein